jgi:hypothetical protein
MQVAKQADIFKKSLNYSADFTQGKKIFTFDNSYELCHMCGKYVDKYKGSVRGC